ncbi:MAG: transcriptional repressor [Actinobacteria bacterium]|nr:transcriptional repressor [Actinomycetota bacterium]
MSSGRGHHHEPAGAWTGHAESALRAAGHRSGGARSSVIAQLAASDCCATAQEVHDAIRASGQRVGLASVYRVLDQLVAVGAVTRVEFGDGVSRFEPAPPDGSHHHHLVCERCGVVRPFESPELERAIHGVGDRERFRVETHEVVLHGRCPDCLPKRA